MKYETIADIYEANDKIRENLKKVVNEINEEQANFLPSGEKWTITSILEHLATVEERIIKILSKLLSKAEAEEKTSDGNAKLSAGFIESVTKSELEQQKLEAPESVQPQRNQTIAESIKQMETNKEYLNALRPKFETVDGTTYTFPHPVFGELTAHDWLTLLGGHEARHTKQIKRVLSKQ